MMVSCYIFMFFMLLYFNEELDVDVVGVFVKLISKFFFVDFLDKVKVEEMVGKGIGYGLVKMFKI